MLSKEKNKFVTRLEKLQRHLVPLISSDETQKNEQKKQAILELWKDLNAATKLTVALLVPVGVYYGYCTVNGIPPIEMVTLSLDTYSQAVSLYALRKMHSQLKENLGVSRTLTRSYQLLSFVGSGIYTTSLLGSINTNFGKSNFIFNLLHTLGYGYFVYLTLLYNYELPDPRDARKMRGVVDWNSLFGFIVVMSFTLYFWIKELSQASITSGNRYNILAMMGFIMTSFGVLRGGFKAAVTSIPGTCFSVFFFMK